MAVEVPPPGAADSNQFRRAHRKVRTGCITCKVRRVKCDETKPECMRCRSTGRKNSADAEVRKCDGYVTPPPKAKTPRSITEVLRTSLPRPPTFFGEQQADPELRSLDFFNYRTKPILAGCFDSELWDRLLLQISQTEPAIRHAMMAVSSFHEYSDEHGLPPPLPERANEENSHAFALQHYTTAIRLLRERLDAGNSPSKTLTLVSCILFVCLEFMRGNILAAIAHLRSGLGILRPEITKRERSPDAEVVRKVILPVFARLSLLQSLYGQPRYRLFAELLDVQLVENGSWLLPPMFTTLEEARIGIGNIMNSCLRYCQAILFDLLPDQLAKLSEQVRLQQRLDLWQKNFYAYLALNPRLPDPRAPKLLQSYEIMARIYINALPIGREKAFDNHWKKFNSLVTILEEIIAAGEKMSSRNGKPPESFGLDSGMISSLWFSAAKCREPQIRRRAIAAMYKTPRREGLWDAVEIAKVAELLMSIEEAPMKDDPKLTCPPEWSRHHDVDVHDRDSEEPLKQAVIIKWKPKGLDTEYEYRKEYIWHKDKDWRMLNGRG